MNKVFVQNNIHPIFAKVLIDVDNLSGEQLRKITRIASIDSVNFELVTASEKNVNQLLDNAKKFPSEFIVNDEFRNKMIRDGFDFCISNLVPNNAGRVFYMPLINFNDFMELIRIILIHNNQFYLETNFKVDDFLYLHSRSNYLFPEYQRIWSFAVDYEMDTPYFETLDSLSNRLKQLIISFDECSFYCFENRGNDSITYAIFYFDSFVSQLASIFSNLANAINYFYGINFSSRKVDLRKEVASQFLNVVNGVDHQLHDKIMDSDFQDFLKLIVNPLRNDIEHNNIPQGVNSKAAISMIISENTWDLISKLNRRQPQECFLNPNYSAKDIYISIYPVLKLLMIFGRKYINYVMREFDLHWKFENMNKSAEEKRFNPQPNPMQYECENSLYFMTYWLPVMDKHNEL